MVHFREPAGAVLAALGLVEELPAAGLPPAHVGVAAGPVVVQGGDYFGRTVNLAASPAPRRPRRLRPDSVQEARDLLWTLNAYAVHDLLVVQRGWSPERYRDWLADTLARVLLPDNQPSSTWTAGSNT
jgi:hypothetical protein